MQKHLLTSLSGLVLAAALALPAWAIQLSTRVASVNPQARTITAIDGKRPYVFTVTERTRFVDAKGTLLAVGLKIGDTDVLVAAARKGYFKTGSRLGVTFEQQGDRLPASQIQFRDITRPKEKDESNTQNQNDGNQNRE